MTPNMKQRFDHRETLLKLRRSLTDIKSGVKLCVGCTWMDGLIFHNNYIPKYQRGNYERTREKLGIVELPMTPDDFDQLARHPGFETIDNT